MRKRLLLIFSLGVLTITGLLLYDVRTRLTLFQPNGYIQSGSMLGVGVGDPRTSAMLKLQKQGVVHRETHNGGTCFFRKVEADRQLDVFFVKSWHGGMVCLVSRNDSVEEVIWAFQPVSL